MPIATVSLETPQLVVPDLQIWSDAKFPYDTKYSSLEFISLVYYERIPLYLLTNGPFDVYSESDTTREYFYQSIVSKSPSVGILAKYSGDDTDSYMVFYAERRTARIRCFCLDFSVSATVSELHQAAAPEDSVFFSMKNAHALKSDTSVFDRVLENKTKKPVAPPASVISSSVLTTPHQISQAISRTVSSGLRLRELSANASSANDRVAIREIYQMTKTAAAFALRKYNYGFNGSSASEVKLTDIQAIVESLLQTFVDLDSSPAAF